MPRESRSRKGVPRALVALLLLTTWSCIAGCDGQLIFDSPSSNAGGAGTAGAAGTSGTAGSSAGAGNTAGADPVSHGPEDCLTDADCGLPGLHCQASTRQCVECLSNQHCPSDRPACSKTTLRCVECASAADCTDGHFCDLQSDKCLTYCRDATVCNGALNEYCNKNGVCATCDGDNDCIPKLGGTLCQRSAGACVQCLDDDQCDLVTPRCLVPLGKCVACIDSRDCASTAPYCDPVLYRCSAAEH